MKSDLSHKINYSVLWEASDFITVNKRISKKHTCIVHGNELISKIKSSNRLGFFSMARYGHPPEGKNCITSENVFSFFKYFVNFFFTKNVRLLSPPNVLPETCWEPSKQCLGLSRSFQVSFKKKNRIIFETALYPGNSPLKFVEIGVRSVQY